MDFFNTLSFEPVARPLRVVKLNGVQWILPDFRRGAGATRVVVNRNAFVADFLNLGQALLRLLPPDYYPGKYQAALEAAAIGSGDAASFLDKLFAGIEGGERMSVFFEKYGLPGGTDVFATDYSGGEKHRVLSEYACASIPEYGDGRFGTTGLEWPVAIMADFIVEIFLLSVKPEEFSERIKQSGFRRIEKTTNLFYTINFEVGFSGYERSCSVNSMFDYAALLILHDPLAVVRECPHCGRVFLPVNMRAVYCGPNCQNRAAVKRSQLKKLKKEV